MRSEIYWIQTPTAGRLGIMPRPRGGDWLDDEITSWRAVGIEIVVSTLTPDEVADLGLDHEAALCNAQGIEFVVFPIPDRGVPNSANAMLRLATTLAERLAAGANIAIHCRQGLGRAPLVAICILVLAGLELKTAQTRAAQARGCPVPETAEQERWLGDFVKTMTLAASK